MAQPNPTQTVTNPRVGKLIELETAGRIKPEHQTELDTYRAQGLAPKKMKQGVDSTEGERKAGAFLTRALGAEQSYRQTGVGPRGMVGQAFKDSFPNASNYLSSDERQVADTNQDEFIAASLRQDSGAAIPEEEMERQRRIYFPMPGDGPEAIEAKRQARLRAIQGLVASAGSMTSEEQKKALEALASAQADAPDQKKQEMLGTLVPLDVAKKIEEGGLPPEQQAAYDAFNKANPNATADQLRQFASSMGMEMPNAEEVVKARDQGGGVAPGSSAIVRAPDISDVRGKDDFAEGADAAVRGAADTLSLGFADEITAGAKTIFGGGTMDENLARERAIDAYDAENSPWLRGGGQLAGGLLFPVGRGATAPGELAKIGGLTGAGYGFGSGETMGERVGGAALGGPTGALLGYGSGKLFQRLGRGRNPDGGGGLARDVAQETADQGLDNMPTDPRAVRDAANDLGVRILPADVSGPAVKRITAGAAQTPFGAGPIMAAAKEGTEQAQTARNRIATAVTDVADDYGAGRAAQRGLTSWIKTSDTRASRLYDAISVPKEQQAVTSNTVKALEEVTKGMNSNQELSSIWAGHPRLKATLDALTPKDTRGAGEVRLTMVSEKVRGASRDLQEAETAYSRLVNDISPLDPNKAARVEAAKADVDRAKKAFEGARAAQDEAYVEARQPPMGGTVSWGDMKRLRSIIGEIIGKPSLTSEGPEISAMRKVYAGLSEDMRATAEKAGPSALREFERANKFWDGRASRIENVVKPILGDDKGDGQAAFNKIQNWAKDKGESVRIAQMVRSLPKDETETIAATVISKLGQAPAGRQGAAGTDFSMSDFLTHWNRLDSRAKSALFTDGQRNALNKLATVAEGTKEAQRFANTSQTAGALGANATTGGLATAMGLLFTGHPVLAALAASPAVGQYVTGRMMASPKFVNWLTRMPKDKKGAATYIRGAERAFAKDGAISYEVQQFGQKALAAMNDNMPAQSAASEGQQEKKGR